MQSFGLLFAIIAAFLLPYLPIFHFVNFAPVNPVLSSVGLILNVAGMAFLVWARQRLGRNWSQTVSAKEEPELVTSGPYRYIRHPMYTGGFIACLGSAIVAGGAFVFLLLFLTDEGGDSVRVVIRPLECLIPPNIGDKRGSHPGEVTRPLLPPITYEG